MSKGVCELLADIATRCNITSKKTLRKSKELIAILNSKHVLRCSDTCKVVVCLELASSLSSCPLDKEEAIKYSGCKKKNYISIYNIVSKLLNLDKIYSVKEICLLLGVNDIQDQATELLQKYINTWLEKKQPDFNHPMYACAAVLVSCRANKIHLNTKKIVEISRIKKLELDELAKRFQSFMHDNKFNSKCKQTTKNLPENCISISMEVKPIQKKRKNNLMTDEKYQEWKKRMLED